MTLASPTEELPAQRGGAKALLLTVLGECVLPSGGEVWTSSLVGAAVTLDISEKNARQAISRIGDQGLIASRRHGRQVRWSLTAAGYGLLEAGAKRIYEFGSAGHDWNGQWLVAHCQVGEPDRAVRTRLRTRLGFLGFGELSASLFVSPHVDREGRLRQELDELGLLEGSIVLRSTTSSAEEGAALVRRAWDLDALAVSYDSFRRSYAQRRPVGAESAFRSVVELVHDWRHFPFTDPELPADLLPEPWSGATAAATFRRCHAEWAQDARDWFADLESHGSAAP